MKKVTNKVELNKKKRKMGFFDNMTKELFKKNEEGTTIYYAKGLFRKGYIVTDKTQKGKLYSRGILYKSDKAYSRVVTCSLRGA